MSHLSPVDALLQQVESLSHQRRCAVLVEFGRCSIAPTERESGDRQNVITTLGAPSQVHYHRLLAACALCGAFAEARRTGRPMPAELLATASSLLEDASIKVSQLLIMPMLVSPPDEDRQSRAMAVKFLQVARVPQFKCLVSRLARRKQTQTLLHLYQTHTAMEGAKMQLLIGSLSPDAFEQLPKEEQAALDTAKLRLLCRYHPQWIGQYLTARVQAQMRLNKAVDATVKELVQKALVFLATRGAAKHGLSLLTSTAHLLGLDQATLRSVLERYYLSVFPVEVGSYLLEGEGQHLLATFPCLLKCSVSRRAWKRLQGHTDLLLRMMDKSILCTAFASLLKMPVEARRAYFARGCEELEHAYGVLDASWILRMPSAAERTALAHRFYNQAKLQDFPAERIGYLYLLPFPEVMMIGVAYVTSSDVKIRCQMTQACLGSLKYYPEHLPAALEFCAQRPKEQDPWRTAMFEAWAALPHGFWMRTATHVADDILQNRIAQLIHAAYSANDISDGTLRELEKLLCRLVGPQTGFAVSQLSTLIHKRKQFSIGVYDREVFLYLAQLYPHALPVLAGALLPLAQVLLRSGSVGPVIGILQSFLCNRVVAKAILRGTSAPNNGEPSTWCLVRDTLRAGMSSRDSRTAKVSLQLYARYFAAQLTAELPDLIAAEKDWVAVREVQLLACNVLQGPLLDMLVVPIDDIPTGRFYDASNKSLPLMCELPLENAYRWTSRQQIRYAQTCLQAVYTPLALQFFQYGTFIKNLARLPSASATTSWTDEHGHARSLMTLATEAHPEYGVYAMRLALQALGQLVDDAAAMQALQNALDVADLRIDALRALARTLRRTPTVEVVRILEPALTGAQVTAQKEALHLLGAKRDEVAYARIVHFAKEHHLPMSAEEGSDCEGDAASSASPVTTSSSTAQAVTVMHGDVRAALVAALFNFLDKPQVWTYYTFIVTQDYVAVQRAAGTEETVATEEEEVEGGVDEVHTAASSVGDDLATPSSAACAKMSAVPWPLLRLPWQVREYQTLLRRLLRHPVRDVRLAALRRLATVPPYDDLVLCKVAADYLDECELPDIVESALKCMLQCTAKEAAPFIISSILAIQPDASLQSVASELCGISKSAAVHEKNALLTVVGEVVAQLVAARRQPGIAVSLILELDISEWIPRLTAMEAAGLMHPGAAAAMMSAVQGCPSVVCDMKAAESLEQAVLRKHSSALMRRLGLAILLAAGEERGWNEERRSSLVTYCEDIDLWVSSDARLVRHD
ncbi:hypothetical protein CUR178_02781 [Leishmania enriettii]|uniref:Uncharacterized protein n=1 Tax=Leishmania enriettii TaxID=5663 RepID=A0A836GEM2_LEIEN|nr:hypothetical protein CUR178_02781 [Leishmania enriettii]